MIKIHISFNILKKHLQYLRESSILNDSKSCEKPFFNKKYIETIIFEGYDDTEINSLQNKLKQKMEKLGKEEEYENILNKEHKEFIKYLADQVKEEKNNNNIFIADPKQLDCIYNKIIRGKFDIIDTLIEIESIILDNIKIPNFKNYYSKYIIFILGYSKFTGEKLKADYLEDYKEILSLASTNFYDNYIKLYNINEIIEGRRVSVKTLELIKEKIIQKLEGINLNNSGDKLRQKIIYDFIDEIKDLKLDKEDKKSIGKTEFKKLIKFKANKAKNKFLDKNLNLIEPITTFNIDTYIKDHSWGAYRFVLELGTLVCPYCNRQYISPLYTEDGKVRGDLDHFLPKFRYPYFVMSIYNLVPSCKFCNSSLKGKKKFNYNDNLNPYEYGYENLLRFTYQLNNNVRFNFNRKDSIKIKLIEEEGEKDIELVRKAKNNAETFQIENLYNYHKEEILELIKKRIMYTEEYIENLYNHNRNIFKNREEVLEFIIGGYIDKENLSKKNLSKLIRDISEELGFLEANISNKQIDKLKEYISYYKD